MNKRKIALAGALSLALSLLAFAEGIPAWKWDESQHPADVKDAEPSAATAIAVATFDVQGSSSQAITAIPADAAEGMIYNLYGQRRSDRSGISIQGGRIEWRR